MDSAAERRRYNRLLIPLAVEYHTSLPKTGEVRKGKGVLRDISLSGSFFQVKSGASFTPGQIVSLTIAAPMPFPDHPGTSHLKATGEIVRLEPPSPANPNYGIALQFMEGLSFAAAPFS